MLITPIKTRRIDGRSEDSHAPEEILVVVLLAYIRRITEIKEILNPLIVLRAGRWPREDADRKT